MGKAKSARTKRRQEERAATKAAKKDGRRPTAVDHLIQRVLDAAWDWIVRIAGEARAKGVTHSGCVLVLQGDDRALKPFYEMCRATGMEGPDLKPYVVTTMHTSYQAVCDRARLFYDLSRYVERPPEAGEVRVLVFTLGTLTFVRLDAENRVKSCSQQYHTLNGDFLINGAVAWRDNQPGGFTFHLIFINSKQGDDFVARCKAETAAIDAADRTKEDIEAELALVKADLVAGRVDAARQSHVCALVAWLENNGHIETDNWNGVLLNYTSEWNLQYATELARDMGAPTDLN